MQISVKCMIRRASGLTESSDYRPLSSSGWTRLASDQLAVVVVQMGSSGQVHPQLVRSIAAKPRDLHPEKANIIGKVWPIGKLANLRKKLGK